MGSYFFAAGYAPETRQMRVVRTAWDGFSQAVIWPGIAPEQTGNGRNPLLLEASRDGAGLVVCAFLGVGSGHGASAEPPPFSGRGPTRVGCCRMWAADMVAGGRARRDVRRRRQPLVVARR